MFSSKYVKILKVDWEAREEEYNELLERVAELEAKNAELEKTQSPLLMNTIKKQSDEISKLLKYKENDDLLYSYEQSNDKQLETIKKQQKEIQELKKENEILLQAYKNESNMTSLLSKKIVNGKYDCKTYRTVSEFEIRA